MLKASSQEPIRKLWSRFRPPKYRQCPSASHYIHVFGSFETVTRANELTSKQMKVAYYLVVLNHCEMEEEEVREE